MPDILPDAAALLSAAGQLRPILGKLSRRLREQAGTGDLTWPQIVVLGRLDRDGPATVTALARSEGVRSQSMGETLAGLKAAGLVAGAPDPADGRQTVLSLTDAARTLIAVSRASRQDWLFHAMQDRLTAEDHKQLASVIALLGRLADI